jgi:multidrug efflux pump subunit AcrB
MDLITRFGLLKPNFTIAMMITVLAVGLMTYLSIPKREDPAVTIRTAVVQASFDGMEPSRIENLIADPIEKSIREIGSIEDIETVITPGQAIVYAHLYDRVSGVGIEDAWEDLRNKMEDVVARLPEGTQGPVVNTDFGDVAVATIAVTGDGFTLTELEEIAEELQRELYQVGGVTEVAISGQQDQRIWLDLDNRKLASVGVQLDQILADLEAQNVILPAGEIDAGGSNVILEANGDLKSVEEIGNVLTKVPGLSGFVRLKDLLTVRRGYVEPKAKPIFFNGDPALVLAVEMAEGVDVQTRGRVLKQRIVELEQQQPIGVSFNISTFQETAITAAVNGALSNVGQTFVVVLLVMLAFLGMRAAFVIACIVPFTVMFALVGMTFMGVEIEKVSIAAVIISLGLLVDNGLVVVEDIEKRINQGMSGAQAALDAGGQFLVPLGVASITTVSAFLPMLLLAGTEGDFAYSLGAVVALMLLGSWLTALYFLPFLASRLLKPKKQNKKGMSGGLVKAYGALVRRLLPYGLPIMLATFALVGISAIQFSKLKPEMFPLSEREEVLIYMSMPKGTAVSATERTALRVQDWLNDDTVNPDIVGTTIYVGDGGPRFYLTLDPDDPDPTIAFFVIVAKDYHSAVELAARSRRTLVEQFPEADFRVTRLSNGGDESGIVDVEILGPDADTLLASANQVKAGFASMPAVVKNEIDWGNKQLKVVVDVAQDKAREFGVTSEDISQVMQAYFSGAQYSTYREGDDQIPIILRAEEPYRDSIEDFINLSISANGDLISIDQVVDFKPKLEFSEIRRKNQVRQITISAKSETMSAQETLAYIQPTLDALELGNQYKINIGAELEDSVDVYSQLGSYLPLALTVMVLALMFQFNSWLRTLITFMTVPIILVGAPYAMLAMGHPMAFFAVLGLMSLMGIIINNAIVLINQIDIEMQTKAIDEAIISAAMQRFTPIMLTSLTTVFGLFPMAISGGVLFEPMATIMIGGLIVASPLTLIFVPSVSYMLLRRSGQSAPADATT